MKCPCTSITKLANIIINPWKQETVCNRGMAWAATIILGIFTFGGIQLLSKCILKASKGPVVAIQSPRIERLSQTILVSNEAPKPLEDNQIPEIIPFEEPQPKKISPIEIKPNDTIVEIITDNKTQELDPKVGEIYNLHQQLFEGSKYAGWLKEHVDSWKFQPAYQWSKDYIANTKDYLTQLLFFKDKSEEEREAYFNRGLQARYLLVRGEDELKQLLEQGVWYRDGVNEENLLIQASFITSTVKAIPVLLASGINPNQRDNRGNTALHWAVANASVDCAEALMIHGTKYGLDCDCQDWAYYGLTPLQLAICKGRRKEGWDELVISLIAHSKDLNKQAKDGNTALHIAYARRDRIFIKALVEAGADLNIRNSQGQLPKELWDVSSAEAWKIIHGTSGTTTFDHVERNSIKN